MVRILGDPSLLLPSVLLLPGSRSATEDSHTYRVQNVLDTDGINHLETLTARLLPAGLGIESWGIGAGNHSLSLSFRYIKTSGSRLPQCLTQLPNTSGGKLSYGATWKTNIMRIFPQASCGPRWYVHAVFVACHSRPLES